MHLTGFTVVLDAITIGISWDACMKLIKFEFVKIIKIKRNKTFYLI